MADKASSELRDSAKMPTMSDVARHLGISRSLVSIVVRDMPGASDETRARVQRAMDELGYQPHASAQLLRRGRTRRIGVVFGVRSAFQGRFVERLVEQAGDSGYGVTFGLMSQDRKPGDVVAKLLEERVEALLVFNPSSFSKALDAARRRVPVIALGEWMRHNLDDNVHVNEIEGIDLAIRHLVELGHRQIAYIGGGEGALSEDRAAAYTTAMTSAGLSDWIDVVPSGFQEDDGAGAARELLERPALPTALVCNGDQSAVGVLAVFAQSGVDVPGNVSVIGFDDSYVASLSYQQMTSIHQDVDATVAAAMGLVEDRLGGRSGPSQRIATSTRLVVRETTGPPRL